MLGIVLHCYFFRRNERLQCFATILLTTVKNKIILFHHFLVRKINQILYKPGGVLNLKLIHFFIEYARIENICT